LIFFFLDFNYFQKTETNVEKILTSYYIFEKSDLLNK